MSPRDLPIYLVRSFVMPKKSKKIFLYPDQNYKGKEILMPSELIERIFDNNKLHWFSTEEETAYLEKKEAYNRVILDMIFKIKFTAKQRTVLDLLFIKGMTLAEVGEILGVTPQDIMNTKKLIIKKVRKNITYNFK